MRLLSTTKRVLTSPSPNAPACPRCRTLMAPTTRTLPVEPVKRAAGLPVNRRLEFAMWFCENCGVKRPRFG